MLKKSAIGQPRKSIVKGQESNPFLGEFAFRDVAKVPDSPSIPTVWVDERRRVSVEHLTILQRELIPAFFVAIAIKILDSLGERFRGFDFSQWVLEHDTIVL
jgi:hypothetical protein